MTSQLFARLGTDAYSADHETNAALHQLVRHMIDSCRCSYCQSIRAAIATSREAERLRSQLINHKSVAKEGDTVDGLLTIAEAAQRLGLGKTKVYEFVMSGELPSLTVGRARRVDAKDLERFIEAQKGGAL